jgi:AraC-like DNA-binding protein
MKTTTQNSTENPTSDLAPCLPLRSLSSERPDPISGLTVAFEFTPHRYNRRGQAIGTGTVYHCEQFLLVDDHLPAGRYRRTAAAVRLDDLDALVISLLVEGCVAVFDEAWLRLHPGDVVILDLAKPTILSATGAHMVHLIVPRMLLPHLDMSRPGVLVHRARGLGASLAASTLKTLAQLAPHTSLSQIRLVSPSLLLLMAAALGTPFSKPSGDTSLAQRVRRYIEDNLKSQTLTPADLARRFGVSRSQLYRIFAGAGGVETYVRSRRLRHSMIALSDPNQAHRRIGDISYALGFADEAHFSRLFRAAYGCSPRAWRKAAMEGLSSTGIPAARSIAGSPLAAMATWLTQMASRQQRPGA